MSAPIYPDRVCTVFLIFLRLGLTAFGGPLAHLGYFHTEFVVRRKWISAQGYTDLVSLCQFLPGPASSQVGIALGFYRAGYRGALAAWIGFTLPSALILILFAISLTTYVEIIPVGVLDGLKIVAVAVIVQAVWGMARSLCTDVTRITIMAISTCFLLLVPSIWSQFIIILIAAILGRWLFQPHLDHINEHLAVPISKRIGVFYLMIFVGLLLILPVAHAFFPNQFLAIIDAFYRTGALVFGGGHVVLPLLQAEVVSTGWIENERFLAGYSITQAMPGPLFTFAAFLGASLEGFSSPWIVGTVCLIAIFLPSFLLVIGTLPFWEDMRRNIKLRAALYAVNAAVVGILLAALYQPIWTETIRKPQDFCLALIALIALQFWKLPIWLVVILGGLIGGLLNSSILAERSFLF